MGDVVKLLAAYLIEGLAPGVEFFIDFDDLLGHDLVGLLGSPDKHEVRAGGQPFVTVGVETDADHDGFSPALLSARISHEDRLTRK